METVIAKYTLIFSVLTGVAVVLKAVLGILGISKRVRGAVAKWILLRLYISLQVEVLGRKKVFKGGVIRV